MLQLQTKAHRFTVLDGLRGVAALVVLTLHLVQQHDLTALPFAGLAVDFFYLLSGFVVAFAYEQRLQSGAMGLVSFVRVRITRLYPLILLGTATGIALALVAAAFKHSVTYQQVGTQRNLGAIASALLRVSAMGYSLPAQHGKLVPHIRAVRKRHIRCDRAKPDITAASYIDCL